MQLRGQNSDSPAFQAGYEVTLICLFLSLAGCNKGLIHATNLPRQYAAPSYPSANKIDLSQLSNDALDSEQLTSGDLLGITIASGLEEVPKLENVRVDDSGLANIPIVGQVPLAGLTLSESETRIREESIRRRKFVDPAVTVTLEKRMMRQVAVFGAVSSPGMYEIPASKCDLAAAISAAGGLTKLADTTVEIRKPAPAGSPFQTVGYHPSDVSQSTDSKNSVESMVIDLTRPEDEDRGQFDLMNGSVVMVKERQPRFVFVTGMVRSPKQVEIPDNADLRLLDAITMAGGRSTPFAQKIKVIRTSADRTQPIYISTSYSEAKEDGRANLRLAAGDVVSMEETPGLLFFDTIRNIVSFGVGASVPVF